MSAAGSARRYAGHAAGDRLSTEAATSERWQRQATPAGAACLPAGSTSWTRLPCDSSWRLWRRSSSVSSVMDALPPLLLGLRVSFSASLPRLKKAARMSWTAQALSLYNIQMKAASPAKACGASLTLSTLQNTHPEGAPPAPAQTPDSCSLASPHAWTASLSCTALLHLCQTVPKLQQEAHSQ